MRNTRSLVLCVDVGVVASSAHPTLAQPNANDTVTCWTYRTAQVQLAAADAGTLAEWRRQNVLRTPLTASADAVYFSSPLTHRVVCLDAATGKLRWQFTAGAAFRPSPTFANGKVYAGSDDGRVYCLDAATGKVIWKSSPPSPRLVLASGEVVSAWPITTNVLVHNTVAYFGSGVFPHAGTSAQCGRRVL